MQKEISLNISENHSNILINEMGLNFEELTLFLLTYLLFLSSADELYSSVVFTHLEVSKWMQLPKPNHLNHVE